MADTTPEEPRLTGNVPLYNNPEPLNRQQHKKFGLRTPKKPYNFLKEAHFVPAVVGEFAFAAGSFPVVFVGDQRMPVIVMGLHAGQNVFVKEDGTFDVEHMIPAFVRRYPFVSAQNGPDQPSTFCVDFSAEVVTDKNPEHAFFDDEGEPTEITQQAIDYVSAFEADSRATEDFVKRLTELNLLELKDISVADKQTPDKKVKIAEYYGVKDSALRELPVETLVEFTANGYMAAIYAHIISLGRWDRIIQRAAGEQIAAEAKTKK
jgi:SapC